VREESQRTVVVGRKLPGIARTGSPSAPAGLAWVDSFFTDRVYDVQHVLVDGQMVAAFLRWRATRRTDGSPVVGVGAYHCRIVDGLVSEDWDVFFPLP
jgi:SnoaL-like domain